jgi:hypothetical protein
MSILQRWRHRRVERQLVSAYKRALRAGARPVLLPTEVPDEEEASV